MKDSEILDLYWARDERALTETQRTYGAYCHSIAWHILYDNEDADECVNDTWFRAWKAIPPGRPGKLALFLGTITREKERKSVEAALSPSLWTSSRNAYPTGMIPRL